MVNSKAIGQFQKYFPGRPIRDVSEDVSGNAHVYFEDGGEEKHRLDKLAKKSQTDRQQMLVRLNEGLKPIVTGAENLRLAAQRSSLASPTLEIDPPALESSEKKWWKKSENWVLFVGVPLGIALLTSIVLPLLL